MRKLQEKFKKLFVEKEKRAKTVKDEDLKKMESISTTCNILVEQINKISSLNDEMKDSIDNETYFIYIKRAESQLRSLEDRLNKVDKENTIQEYKFEPGEKLNAMLDEMKTVGTSSLMPMLKTPIFIEDIDIQHKDIRGLIMRPNQRLLITNFSNTVMLIDTTHNTIVSQLQLPDILWDVTQVKDGAAITCFGAEKIQFVSLFSNELSMGREMSVDGRCFGIEYNDQDDTLIVTYDTPPKVEILSLTGTVIKRFDKDANGAKLFTWPPYVALSPDKTMMYVTDHDQNSVTLMTLAGDVKAIYKNKTLQGPRDVCVNRSGIVYVVGHDSHTVHQIVPGSDKLEPLLDEEDGLKDPWTIIYCDAEDKLYVGQVNESGLTVFKMK